MSSTPTMLLRTVIRYLVNSRQDMHVSYTHRDAGTNSYLLLWLVEPRHYCTVLAMSVFPAEDNTGRADMHGQGIKRLPRLLCAEICMEAVTAASDARLQNGRAFGIRRDMVGRRHEGRVAGSIKGCGSTKEPPLPFVVVLGTPQPTSLPSRPFRHPRIHSSPRLRSIVTGAPVALRVLTTRSGLASAFARE